MSIELDKIKKLSINYKKLDTSLFFDILILNRSISKWIEYSTKINNELKSNMDYDYMKNLYIKYLSFLSSITNAKAIILTKFMISDIEYYNKYYSEVKTIVDSEKSLKRKIPSKDSLSSLANKNCKNEKDLRALAAIVSDIFDNMEKQIRTSIRVLDKIMTLNTFTDNTYSKLS